jgi:hypothetical protein
MTAYVQSDLNHNIRHTDDGPDLVIAEFTAETDNERQHRVSFTEGKQAEPGDFISN